LPSPSPSSATTRSARGPWTPTLILAALALLWLCASGCGETVLFQLEGGEWVRSANRVDVRGWYAVSPEEVE